MNADRNLLFGVLALQTDLIDATQFADGCAAWAARKNMALAEILIERGWITTTDKADVDRLLERKLKRHGGDLLATIEAVADAGVRQALVTVDDSELGRTIARLSVGGHVLVDSLARPSETKTRYTLSRLQGQGGLGRVWVARDNDLNREVALKELHAESADDPGAKSRFLKEAQITGQLEHPNIVPVYELGHRENDRTFYTMRFLRGATFRHAITEYHKRRRAGADDPLELRRLLGAFVGVCHALAYAHSRGVVHRDVKPSNIALGHFGEVVLLDWGLAKIARAGDESSDTLALPDSAAVHGETQAGRALGTPSYMAPEQAQGQLERIGPATDVYGLGATLFELVTGRPPHKGDNTAETLDCIVKGATPRARAIEPSVPVALDAICAKAMAKEPGDRYAKASELADDIQRWLGDEPVSCYVEPRAQRIARWARRHRAWTQAAAAALVMVSLVSSGAAVIVERARASELEAHAKTERALGAEVAAKDEATQYFKEARAAVDGYLSNVDDVLKHFPLLQGARVRLLRKSAADYERFAQMQSDNIELRAEFGRTLIRLAGIYQSLDEPEQAEQVFQSAVTFFDALVHAKPDDIDLIVQRANSRLGRGNVIRDIGRYDEAERAYRVTIDELRGPVSDHPESVDLGESFAMCLFDLGLLEHALGRHSDAATTVREAIERFERLAAANPKRPRLRFMLATALNTLGQMQRSDGQIDRAMATLSEAMNVLGELVRQHPRDEEFRQALADSRVNLAAAHQWLGDDGAERREYEAAIADYDALCKEFPDSPLYRENVARAQQEFGELLHRMDENLEAKRVLDAARNVFADLLADQPGVVPHHEELAATRTSLAQVLSDLGQLEDAESELRAAIDSLSLLVKKFEPPQYRERLAVALSQLGRVLHKQKRIADAQDSFDSAIQQFRTLLNPNENQPQYRNGLAWCLTYRADLLRDMGNEDDAKKTQLDALDIREKLAAEFPHPEYLHNLAWFLTTAVGSEIRDPAKALAAATSAAERTTKSAVYWNSVGVAHYRGENWADCLQALSRAEGLRSDGHCADWFFAAMACWQSGEKDRAQKFFDRAVKWMQKNCPDNLEQQRIHAEARACLGM